MRYRAISELVEIWSAYDTAAENFPDTLEPDSVEGRREIISSALNYIKDNGVVPSQQSLGMLQNELIRYDRDNYEGLFGFATNEKETRDLIEQNWDIDGFIVYVNLEWSIPTNKLAKYIKSDIFPIIHNLKIEGILCFEDFDIIRKMENLVFINLRNTIIFDAKSKQFGSIPEAAFKSMNIVSVVLPESIRIIGRAAFECCKKLQSISFPKTVDSIESFAFHCTGLATVTIPDTVRTIGHSVFADSPNLTTAVVGDGLEDLGKFTFSKCKNLKFVQLGQNLQVIDYGDFEHCSNISFIVLPSRLSEIGDNAFYGCTGLSFLVFPKSLRYIGNYSFDSCSGLVKLYIGDNITYIGHSAFGHCANLEEITLSENVASIQHNAFKESLNLRTIYCKSKNPPSVLEKHWHGSNKRSMNLYVPKGFSNRYKIQEGWRFFNIYEEDI